IIYRHFLFFSKTIEYVNCFQKTFTHLHHSIFIIIYSLCCIMFYTMSNTPSRYLVFFIKASLQLCNTDFTSLFLLIGVSEIQIFLLDVLPLTIYLPRGGGHHIDDYLKLLASIYNDVV